MIARAIGYVVAGRNFERGPETPDPDPPAMAAYRYVLAWLAGKTAAASSAEPSPPLQARNSS